MKALVASSDARHACVEPAVRQEDWPNLGGAVRRLRRQGYAAPDLNELPLCLPQLLGQRPPRNAAAVAKKEAAAAIEAGDHTLAPNL